MRISESYRLCNKQTNLYVFVDVFKNVKNLERNKELCFVTTHQRFQNWYQYKPLLAKFLEETSRLVCSSCFPRQKSLAFLGQVFCIANTDEQKKNRDEIKINTFSKKYFSCWSEIKSLSQYDNYTCLKPMYSLHNLLKSKILYKSSRHRKVEVLTLFSLLMT